ncbi:arylesterase [Phenylobacterium deserti]|uniref:Arylesterase n=1 Tax=Phenylobacterium deserti TaxID=1914756 RepID=A0A328A867_9CAUL|nr:arylesterase [Phenylobacterium deserti]RAK50710.1 arylesterase [Phenylobacterium deserti]
MAETSDFSTTRRTLLAAGLAVWPVTALAARGKVVTMLGDSITAGLGLPAAAALPNQLHLALERMGVANVVRGAGVSGDTTAGGASRVNFSVQPDTSVCVVALGGNDLLRGIDPRTSRANLERILTRLRARRMGIVLAGIAAPPEIGRNYARDFNAIFPALARQYGAALYPDLLAGVGRRRALNQPDGIHPNAEGVKIIARGLAPVVAKALAARP